MSSTLNIRRLLSSDALLFGAEALSPLVKMKAIRESPVGYPNHFNNERGKSYPNCQQSGCWQGGNYF